MNEIDVKNQSKIWQAHANACRSIEKVRDGMIDRPFGFKGQADLYYRMIAELGKLVTEAEIMEGKISLCCRALIEWEQDKHGARLGQRRGDGWTLYKGTCSKCRGAVTEQTR